MEYPGCKKQHFQHLLFSAFHRGQKVAEAAQDICMVYGEGVIGKSIARKMTILTSTTCPIAEDHLKGLLKEESHQTSRELAEKKNCDQKTILNHLHSMGFAKKLEVWVPHELSKSNKKNHLQIA